MVAVVNGCPYTRVQAGSKRDCRTGAAYLAWRKIILEDQEKASSFHVILITVQYYVWLTSALFLQQ